MQILMIIVVCVCVGLSIRISSLSYVETGQGVMSDREKSGDEKNEEEEAEIMLINK